MDSIGIPTITISNNDTLLYASDTKAETIFEKYGVCSFTLAFPSITLIDPSMRHGLDSVYMITCTGDASNLMLELMQLQSPVYTGIEQVGQIVYLSGGGTTPYIPNDLNLIQDDYALSLIRATEAWGITHGSPDIKIGITETGVYQTMRIWQHKS